MLTTAFLQAFDERQRLLPACLGSMATGTRLTGIALISALLLVGWQEGRSRTTHIATIAADSRLFLFSLYCTIRFADPLAYETPCSKVV